MGAIGTFLKAAATSAIAAAAAVATATATRPLARSPRRLQPVKETQQKQRLLWGDLILRYCRHHRVFVVSAEEADDFPLFHNAAINRERRWGPRQCPRQCSCTEAGGMHLGS